MLKRLALTLLGVPVALAWWSLRGSPGHTSTDTIPQQVFGGGTVMAIEVELSHAGRLSAAFSHGDELIEATQRLEAGTHAFSVEAPAGIGGSFTVEVDAPPVGATARVKVGELEDRQQLDEPLQPGTAFFAQVELSE